MHTSPLTVLATLWISWAAHAPAQEPTPVTAATPAIDTTPELTVDSVGPGGWRSRLGPTNLGSLLASEKGRALWKPLAQPLIDAWSGATGGDVKWQESLARWTGYTGHVRVGIWIDPTSRMGNVHSRAIGVVLHGDGRTDLQTLAEDLRLLLDRRMPGEWGEQELDGTRYKIRVSSSEQAFDPIVANDRLQLLLVSDADLAGALSSFRDFAAINPVALRPDSPAMTTRVDLPRIMTTILGNEGNERRLLVALGMQSLGQSVSTIGAAGPRLHLSTSQSFTGAARGLFAALLPAATAPSDLVELVPADAALWKVGRFEMQKLFTTFLDAVAAFDMGKREEIEAGMHEELGIDLAQDLLAHITDEVMFALGEAPDDDEEPDDWMPERTNWMLVWKLRDTAKFAAGLEQLLAQSKPFISREATNEDGEIKFHRYGSMFSYDLWLTTGNGLFGIAGGQDAESQLIALQQRAAGKAEKGRAPHVTDFAMLERWLPKNTYGQGFGHPSWLTFGPTELWLQIWQELVPAPPGVWPDQPLDDDACAAVRTLLREHQLDRLFTATGQADGAWTFSLYW